jgi:hypothetical protein
MLYEPQLEAVEVDEVPPPEAVVAVGAEEVGVLHLQLGIIGKMTTTTMMIATERMGLKVVQGQYDAVEPPQPEPVLAAEALPPRLGVEGLAGQKPKHQQSAKSQTTVGQVGCRHGRVADWGRRWRRWAEV